MIYRIGQSTLNFLDLPLSEYLENRKYARERISAVLSLRDDLAINFPEDYLEAFSSRFVMEYLGSPCWKTLFDWELEKILKASANCHVETRS